MTHTQKYTYLYTEVNIWYGKFFTNMLETIRWITYEKIIQNNIINNTIYNIISNHSNKKKCIKKYMNDIKNISEKSCLI